MKAKLTTLTPVHIGNGITLNKNVDFIQVGDKIGIVDEKKVFELLGQQQVNSWSEAIIKGNDSFIDLLKLRGWEPKNIETVCSGILNLKSANNKSTQLKEHYRSSLKGLTIPGSSIKGAIKTAIFNMLVEDYNGTIVPDDMKTWKETWDKSTGRAIRKGVKWSDSKLESKIFGDNANEKSTRFIKIRDVHFENTYADAYEVKILNAAGGGWRFKEGQQILIETIPAEASSEFDFIVDGLLLQKNIEAELKAEEEFKKNPHNRGINYKVKWPNRKFELFDGEIEKLCSLINENTKYLLEVELHNLQDETFNDVPELIDNYSSLLETCENAGHKEMVLRIGGQSGYVFTTAQWMGMDNRFGLPKEDFNDLRKVVQRRDYSNMEIWPKTRKMSPEGQLFGFVKISFA